MTTEYLKCMTQATLGFILNSSLDKVLLITKNRPDWQKGKINGVGGKTEDGETAQECVSREVFEEAGITIDSKTWHTVASLDWDTWQVKAYAAIYEGNETDVTSITDEIVSWYPVSDLPSNVMSNLHWLIPLAIDVLTNETPPRVIVTY